MHPPHRSGATQDIELREPSRQADHFIIGVDLKWRLMRNRKNPPGYPNDIIRWLISRILLFVLPQKVNKKVKAYFYPQAPSSEKLSSAGDFLLSSELPACTKLSV
jgi:hypothetical protein